MLSKRKILILIRRYAKIIGIKDPKLIERVFMRGDIFQKKRDLIAMRATVYAKRNIKPGTSYEDQQKLMEEFTKTQNLKDAHFPTKVKIKDDKTGQPSKTKGSGEGQMPESDMPVDSKS